MVITVYGMEVRVACDDTRELATVLGSLATRQPTPKKTVSRCSLPTPAIPVGVKRGDLPSHLADCEYEGDNGNVSIRDGIPYNSIGTQLSWAGAMRILGFQPKNNVNARLQFENVVRSSY